MSNPCSGRVYAEAAVGANSTQHLPIDPATGAVRVVASATAPASLVRFQPMSLIYSTAAAGETFSLIPAAANPASLVWVHAHLRAAAAAAYFIQLHRGNAQPAGAAVPLLVSDVAVPVGGNYQIPFDVYGVERLTTGYVVTLSTTQDTYTDPNVAMLVTRAFGQLP